MLAEWAPLLLSEGSLSLLVYRSMHTSVCYATRYFCLLTAPCTVVTADALVMCLQAPLLCPRSKVSLSRDKCDAPAPHCINCGKSHVDTSFVSLKCNRSVPCVAFAPRTIHPLSEPLRQIPDTMVPLVLPSYRPSFLRHRPKLPRVPLMSHRLLPLPHSFLYTRKHIMTSWTQVLQGQFPNTKLRTLLFRLSLHAHDRMLLYLVPSDKASSTCTDQASCARTTRDAPEHTDDSSYKDALTRERRIAHRTGKPPSVSAPTKDGDSSSRNTVPSGSNWSILY